MSIPRFGGDCLGMVHGQNRAKYGNFRQVLAVFRPGFYWTTTSWPFFSLQEVPAEKRSITQTQPKETKGDTLPWAEIIWNFIDVWNTSEAYAWCLKQMPPSCISLQGLLWYSQLFLLTPPSLPVGLAKSGTSLTHAIIYSVWLLVMSCFQMLHSNFVDVVLLQFSVCNWVANPNVGNLPCKSLHKMRFYEWFKMLEDLLFLSLITFFFARIFPPKFI